MEAIQHSDSIIQSFKDFDLTILSTLIPGWDLITTLDHVLIT